MAEISMEIFNEFFHYTMDENSAVKLHQKMRMYDEDRSHNLDMSDNNYLLGNYNIIL